MYLGVFQIAVAFETDSTGVCVTPQESSTGVLTCLGRFKQKFWDYLDDDDHAEVAPAAGERREHGEERTGGRSG